MSTKMTEEELAAKAAMEAKAKADAEADADKDDEDDKSKSEDENKPDYDALLAEEKARTEAALKAAADANFKLREKKRKEEDDEEEDENDEDKPLTAKQLQAILAKDREATRKEVLGTVIMEKATKLAKNPSEAAYIVELHKNRSFPANLSIDEQLEECYAIANRKVLLAQNEELKRALNSKENKSSGTGNTYKDGTPGTAPKMAAHDAQALTDAGMTWDAIKKIFKKPIAGGKKNLCYDPKTHKRWVE